MSALWRHKSKVIKDYFYAKSILAHSFMDRFWWKFVWILLAWRNLFSLNCDLQYHFYVFFKIFYPHYNLDLHSYGQLLSFFYLCLNIANNLYDAMVKIFSSPVKNCRASEKKILLEPEPRANRKRYRLLNTVKTDYWFFSLW